MSDESKAIKVAILGGGMAAMTAAFELTDPSLHGKYEVTSISSAGAWAVKVRVDAI